MENEYEINLLHLLCELRRNWKPISVISILFAIIFLVYSSVFYVPSSADYCAEAVIRISNISEDEELSEDQQGTKDYSGLNESMIKSDAVLQAAISESGVQDVTVAELRDSIYTQFEYYGGVAVIDVVRTDSDEAISLCAAIVDCAEAEYASLGDVVEIEQTAFELGAVTVTETTTNGTTTYTIESAEEPSYDFRTSVVKKGLIGLLVGFVLAYGYVCALFIFRGKIIYSGQLEPAGIPVLSVISKNTEPHIAYETALSNILAIKPDATKLAVIKYGTDYNTDALCDSWTRYGIDTNISNDVLAHPMDTNIALDADVSVLLIQSNTITAADLSTNLVSCIGAIFVD